MRTFLTFLALAVLAACATPRERCERDATRDLRTVNALIAESEATIDRGYALRREVYTRPRLTFCSGTRRSDVGVSFCSGPETLTRLRPVAVDLADEQRKLDGLRAKKAELEVRARRDLGACTGL